MPCLKYEDQLIDFIEGILSPEETEEFQQHLSECPNCQKTIEQQREIFRKLENEIERIDIPHDFMQQVEERLNDQPTLRRKVFGWRIAAVAVALCILLFSTDLTTGMMNGVLQWWQGLSGSQQANGDPNGIGKSNEPTHLVVEDENIRLSIDWINADEFQTELFYTILDLNYLDSYLDSNIEAQ